MRSEYCKGCYLDRPKGWISICRKQTALQGMVVQGYIFSRWWSSPLKWPPWMQWLSLQSSVGLLASLCTCSSGIWNFQFLSQEDRNYFSGLAVLVPVFLNFCIVFTRVQYLMIFSSHCCTVATHCSYFMGMKCSWGSEAWSCIGQCVSGHWTKASTLGSFLYPDPNQTILSPWFWIKVFVIFCR